MTEIFDFETSAEANTDIQWQIVEKLAAQDVKENKPEIPDDEMRSNSSKPDLDEIPGLDEIRNNNPLSQDLLVLYFCCFLSAVLLYHFIFKGKTVASTECTAVESDYLELNYRNIAHLFYEKIIQDVSKIEWSNHSRTLVLNTLWNSTLSNIQTFKETYFYDFTSNIKTALFNIGILKKIPNRCTEEFFIPEFLCNWLYPQQPDTFTFSFFK